MGKPVTVTAARSATARVVSPIRLFVLLLAVLFVAEAVIMFTLPLLFPDSETLQANIADSLLLITISAPFIWVLIVQPLRNAVKTEAKWATALLEHVIDGVVIVDGHGIVASLNPAAEQIFGYSSREVAGQHLRCLLDEQGESDKKLFPPYGSPDGWRRLRHDTLGRHKDGSTFPMDISVSRVSLAGETASIVIVRDTTERRQIEAAMIEKQHQLAELNLSLEERVAAAVNELRDKDRFLLQQSRLAAMGELVNNIAHQWRQPLNVLGLLVQQMRLYFDSGSFSKEFLDSSVSKSMGLINHMSRTINDFMNFYASDKEKVEFTTNEVVEKTLSLVEDAFKNQQIGIDFRANDRPAIFGYPNEYSQALLNILMNAKDALVENRPDNAVVTVTISTEGDRSVVTIADNAGGIAEEIMGMLFDPYFTTKGPDRGTGVGLFLSKSIIEKNMGGSLTVRNTAEGAEFRIVV